MSSPISEATYSTRTQRARAERSLDNIGYMVKITAFLTALVKRPGTRVSKREFAMRVFLTLIPRSNDEKLSSNFDQS